MGLFSKLKDFFSGKSIESLKEYEPEIQKLQKKSNSEIIALIGTHGRLKGLPIIYASSDDSDIRRHTAKITELIAPLTMLTEEDTIRDVTIRYYGSILFYKPISKTVSFFARATYKTDISTLDQWVNNNTVPLREILA